MVTLLIICTTCILLDICGGRLAEKVAFAIEIVKEIMPPSRWTLQRGTEANLYCQRSISERFDHPTCPVEFATKLLDLLFTFSTLEKKSGNHMMQLHQFDGGHCHLTAGSM